MKAIRYYFYYEQVSISTRVNGFLYYLQRIPLIGRKIPRTIYQIYSLKKILCVFLFLFRILKGFFMKFVWLGVYYFLASFIIGFSIEGDLVENAMDILFMGEKNTLWLGLLLWFILVVLVKGFSQGWFANIDERVLSFVEDFDIPKQFFIRCQLMIDIALHILFYIPASLVFGSIVGEPWRITLGIILLYASFSYFFSYLGRLFFMYFSTKKSVEEVLGAVIIIALLGSAVLLVVFEKGSWGEFLFTPVAFVLSMLLLLVSIRQLLTFRKGNAYITYMYQESLIVRDVMAEAKKEGELNVSMQEDMVLEPSDTCEEMNGSNYLNALLFRRYRKLLHKALRWRLIGITVLGIGLVLLRFFAREDSIDDLYGLIPSLFFLMYLISFGKKIVQMAFVNCDVAMLHYPFYREKHVIISGFIYRFKKTLLYNGLLAGLCYFFFILAAFINTKSVHWMFMGITTFTFISLVLLFSFHELFIYYLLQPFSCNMEVVNPIYKIVSGVFWFFAYINMSSDVGGLKYVLILATVSFLYVIIGFVVMMKVAPRTFRMK